MFLLGAVTLCCGVVAGTFALLEPVLGQDRGNNDKPVAASSVINAGAQMPVRVVGAPFEPNVNPRERYLTSPRRDLRALLGLVLGTHQFFDERDDFGPLVGRQ